MRGGGSINVLREVWRAKRALAGIRGENKEVDHTTVCIDTKGLMTVLSELAERGIASSFGEKCRRKGGFPTQNAERTFATGKSLMAFAHYI